MRDWDRYTHWTSERIIAKSKQRDGKRKNISLETKKKIPGNILPVTWKWMLDSFHKDEQKTKKEQTNIEASEIWLYRSILNIPWANPVNNNEVIGYKKQAFTQNQGKIAEITWGLENLTHTRYIESKRDTEKHHTNYMAGLCEWMAARRRES